MATLIIGLGGKGCQIVERIATRAAKEGVEDVEFVVMDTDVNELRQVRRRNSRIRIVQTSPTGIVGAALDNNRYARDGWFPLNTGLMGKPFTEGAGQVRAVSRLAFDHAVAEGKMRPLEIAIENLRGLSGEAMHQEMRIMITGSIAGGTGSGILLPVALYIRNYLITRYQDDSAIIRGYFMQPDTIFDNVVDEQERSTLRCNAYATIRELDAFFRKEYSGEGPEFRHVMFNAPQPGMTERMDYPNILPYHYFFLMDAINAAGERLYNSKQYVEHISDIIYAQTLSAGAAKSNSAEDNVIRLLSASGGRSRYCGAGCAYLEYPAEAVQRLVGLGWAADSISGEWMEIDNDYQRLVLDDKEIDRDEHYCSFFEARRDRGFYKKASRGTRRAMKSEDRSAGIVEKPVAEMFVDGVIDHASTWNDSGLEGSCNDLRVFLESTANAPFHVPESSAEVEADIDENGGVEALASNFDAFFNKSRRYYGIISESVTRSAKSYGETDYRVLDSDPNPLKSRKDSWHLEPYVNNGDQPLHPSGVRYLLSSIIIRLRERLNNVTQERDGKQASIRSALNEEDYYAKTEIREDPQAAVSAISAGDSEEGNVLTRLMKRGGLSPSNYGELAQIGQTLNELASDIDEYRRLVVERELVNAALEYVTRLNRAYVAFYAYLGEQIDSLENEVTGLMNDGDFNAKRGVTRRYVCASTKCLESIRTQCHQKGSAGDIPYDLCGDIYRGLLKFTRLLDTVAEERDMSTEAKNRQFGKLYNEAVKDFWIKRVVDPEYGYPAVVDKTIIQAILDEARYTNPTKVTDDEQGQHFLENYLATAFAQAQHIATPFIEPPVGEHPRPISLCVYSSEITKGVGKVSLALEDILSKCNGEVDDAGRMSKNVIMFYRSFYGFCATNLPKFAPEHKGMQHRPEGEYHRDYWNTVKKLSPDLNANKLITPHIDKNWHLISYLPDLNEDYERELKNEIMRAYIYGLTSREFGSDFVINNHLFYLTARKGASRVDLTVSNGTRCDHFYEVFDALKYNPPVVYELLSRSDRQLAQERMNAVMLSPVTSKLVRNISSQAFGAETLTPSMVVRRIDEYADNEDALAGVTKLSRMDANKFLSDMVTNMFGTRDSENNIIRRSIFEIPVFYKISLPHSEARVGEIDSMLDGILETVHDYFIDFCDPNELDHVCEEFFEEQYLRFEHNMVSLDASFPGCATDRTANTVRDKVLSFFDLSSDRGDRLWHTRQAVDGAWDKVLERRHKVLVSRIAALDEA